MTPEDIRYFDDKFNAVKEHFDDKIHAMKSAIAVQNQQSRIDLEQMYSYHKEHFDTGKIVAKLEASVHGVDHQGGLVRTVADLEKESHTVPCKEISELKIAVCGLNGEGGLVRKLREHIEGHWKWVGTMTGIIALLSGAMAFASYFSKK